jgi:hypothetical protein
MNQNPDKTLYLSELAKEEQLSFDFGDTQVDISSFSKKTSPFVWIRNGEQAISETIKFAQAGMENSLQVDLYRNIDNNMSYAWMLLKMENIEGNLEITYIARDLEIPIGKVLSYKGMDSNHFLGELGLYLSELAGCPLKSILPEFTQKFEDKSLLELSDEARTIAQHVTFQEIKFKGVS